jgi:hypothetical protein
MRVLTLTFVAALVLLATYRMAGQPTFFCEDQDGSTWNSGPEGYGCGEVVRAKVPTRKQFNPVAWDAWLAGLSESKNIADWRTSEEKALDNEHWLNPIPAPPQANGSAPANGVMSRSGSRLVGKKEKGTGGKG